MRPYDDLVEVPGSRGSEWSLEVRANEDRSPDQFLWRGRLWQVREVIAHWRESGAWWVRPPEEAPGRSELVCEREVWRVAAARGRAVAAVDEPASGVFDLTLDLGEGVWRLAGSLD